MREICTSGSEGGGVLRHSPYPYQLRARGRRFRRGKCGGLLFFIWIWYSGCKGGAMAAHAAGADIMPQPLV